MEGFAYSRDDDTPEVEECEIPKGVGLCGWGGWGWWFWGFLFAPEWGSGKILQQPWAKSVMIISC